MEWRNTAHVECVKTWMDEAADGLSSAQVVDLFEQAMRALWTRSVDTLGLITLTAILDRVLDPATQQFPQFRSLTVGVTGIDAAGLREPATASSSHSSTSVSWATRCGLSTWASSCGARDSSRPTRSSWST